jgi:hypothetical protein
MWNKKPLPSVFRPLNPKGEDAMPLAFEYLSHGTNAFGFFNFESDMLILVRPLFHIDSIGCSFKG